MTKRLFFLQNNFKKKLAILEKAISESYSAARKVRSTVVRFLVPEKQLQAR